MSNTTILLDNCQSILSNELLKKIWYMKHKQYIDNKKFIFKLKITKNCLIGDCNLSNKDRYLELKEILKWYDDLNLTKYYIDYTKNNPNYWRNDRFVDKSDITFIMRNIFTSINNDNWDGNMSEVPPYIYYKYCETDIKNLFSNQNIYHCDFNKLKELCKENGISGLSKLNHKNHKQFIRLLMNLDDNKFSFIINITNLKKYCKEKGIRGYSNFRKSEIIKILKRIKFHGKGRLTYPNDDIYDGDWKDGEMNGHGIMIYSNGSYYKGQWKDSKYHYKGTLLYPNCSFKNIKEYVGEFKEGKINGHGIMTYSNKGKFEGEFKDSDPYNGHGMVILRNGNIYQGEWKDGKANGHGLLIIFGYCKYESEFKDGKIKGRGIMTYNNGNVYIGDLKDDLININVDLEYK